MNSRPGVFLTGIVMSALAWPALADVTITEESSLVDGSEAATMTIYLTDDRVRVDNRFGNDVQAFIFDAGRELFWMVDYGRRTYMEMTLADLQRMTTQMSAALTQLEPLQAQIEAQLQGLPEDQRRVIEEALRAQFPTEPAETVIPTMEYRLVASGEPVGDWSADLYEALEDGTRVWDIWTIDWAEAGVAESDFAVFERMGEIMESMAPAGEGNGSFAPLDEEAGGPSGIPVRRVSYLDGEPDARFEITDISNAPLGSDIFTVPEGFSPQTLPPF